LYKQFKLYHVHNIQNLTNGRELKTQTDYSPSPWLRLQIEGAFLMAVEVVVLEKKNGVPRQKGHIRKVGKVSMTWSQITIIVNKKKGLNERILGYDLL
jgi:hypothetical protein